jgi:hypothetical protein
VISTSLAVLAILGIASHLFPTGVLTLSILLSPSLYFVYRDYKAFLALGPGGTPSTPAGYLKISILRLFAVKDPLLPPPVYPSLYPSTGYFSDQASFPRRTGSRPRVGGIAPHRQLDQKGTKETDKLQREQLLSFAAALNTHFRTAPSCFEKRGLSLYSTAAVNRTCNGEIAHLHDTEKSLHVTLHPADVAVVLAAAWGERHPLADGTWVGRYVPSGFVMVYAPRNEEEVRVVGRILRAAVWWVSGVRLEDGLEIRIAE